MKKATKKILYGSMSVLALSMAMSSVGFAASSNKVGGEDLAVVNVSDNLLIRSEANTSAEVVGYVKGGAGVLVKSLGTNWSKIKSGKVTGYVKTGCLAFDEKAEKLKEVYGVYGAVAAWDDVKIFSDYENTSSIIGTINAGEGFEIVGSSDKWIEIQLKSGDTAFVAAEDVRATLVLDTAIPMNDDVAEVTVTESKPAVETPVAAATVVPYTEETEIVYEEPAYVEETEAVYEEPAVIETEAVYEEPVVTETEAVYEEPVVTETEAVYEEPEVVETEPEVIETEAVYEEPEVVETEPAVIETEAIEEEPEVIETEAPYEEPEVVETEPEVVETEATYEEPEVIETEPAYDETEAGEEVYEINLDEEDEDTDTEVSEEAEAADDTVYEETAPVDETIDEEAAPVDDTVIEEQTGASQEEAPAPEVTADDKDLDLLAALIYCEAGNQPYEGMVAVGQVVMNRVASDSFADSINDVIYESGQFTPAYSGQLDSVMGSVPEDCYNAALDALNGEGKVGDALYFNTGSGKGEKIGAHQFY